MGQVGNLGERIVFEVNDKKFLTFSNLKRTVSGRWTLHNSIGDRQAAEFLGPALDKITLQIVLLATLGVKPRKVLEEIEEAVKTGEVNLFIINGKQVGSGPYRITAMSEAWETLFQNGELVQAKLDLTLEEYA